MLGYMLKDIKDLLELICAALYAPFLFLIHESPLRTVIYYHSVSKADVPSFVKQMAYLAKKCSVVKPSKIKNMPSDKDRTLAAITFDDAFASVIENAVPILKEHGFPAGIFVPAGNLGQHPRWEIPDGCPDRYETVMSEEQIAELDKDGFEMFSHTLSHTMLTNVSINRLTKELKDSKNALEEIVGHHVLAVSYPYGAYDSRVCNAAKQTGYQLGFTIEPQIVNNCTGSMQIGRFRVSAQDSLLKFKLKVFGAYQVVKFLQQLQRILR